MGVTFAITKKFLTIGNSALTKTIKVAVLIDFLLLLKRLDLLTFLVFYYSSSNFAYRVACNVNS